MKAFSHWRSRFLPTPPTIGPNEGALYFKSDGNLYKKVGSTESKLEGASAGVGTVTGSNVNFGQNVQIPAGTTMAVTASTFTPPPGARLAVILLSGGFKATVNAAGIFTLIVNGAERRTIRVHNNADVSRTPSGSGLAIVDLAGMPANVPYSVTAYADSGGGPFTCIPFNLTFEYIT